MKWFVLDNDIVEGPFEDDHIISHYGAQTLVWGHPMSEWLKLSEWSRTKNQLKEESVQEKNTLQWHLAVDGESFGPFTRSQLVEKIRPISNRKELYVWNQDLPKWESIYSFSDILNDLGEKRRKHRRYEIEEVAHITPADKNEFAIFQITSLSAGGFGGKGLATSCRLGQSFNIRLDFLDTHEPILFRAQVRSVSNDYFGFEFEKLPVEVESALISYLQSLEAESEGSSDQTGEPIAA